MDFNQTPSANRLHLAVFGRRNSGKSSLINAIVGQDLALVSEHAGTTTDPVRKAMEIHPLGPCVLIDTAGFDDEGDLGALRVERTRKVLDETDVALLVFDPSSPDGFGWEDRWMADLNERNVPVVAVINKSDRSEAAGPFAETVRERYGIRAVAASAKTGENTGRILEAVAAVLPDRLEPSTIAGHLVQEGDSVLLVTPQDIQAPKGRLILPQVQTIRDLLDHRCVVTCCTSDKIAAALRALAKPPALIITDSQAFGTVYAQKPPESRLTSFSVLFAEYKGDIRSFVEGAEAIDRLNGNSRVLIAEACSHNPLDGDIGRVKLPALLRKQAGPGLTVEVVSGRDFPEDLSPYNLIIHCGACMFTRRMVITRLASAKRQGIPMTNYGIAIAKLKGILEHVQY